MKIEGIKLGFNLKDYARLGNMGCGSFRVKDGSEVYIIGDAARKKVDFFQVKDGYLLGAKGYRGKMYSIESSNLLGTFMSTAEDFGKACYAWTRGLKL